MDGQHSKDSHLDLKSEMTEKLRSETGVRRQRLPLMRDVLFPAHPGRAGSLQPGPKQRHCLSDRGPEG